MLKKAFTVVELLVVISILVILSTIWFFLYLENIEEIKDANRTTQVNTIWDGIDVYLAKWIDVSPENSIEIFFDWQKYSTQWIIGTGVTWKIKYLSSWLDPKDKNPFIYSLWFNKRDYDIMALLENEINMPKQLLSWDFTKIWNRVPYVYWKNKVWIMLDQSWNPVNYISTWTLSLNCSDSNNYMIIFENGRVLSPITFQSEFETWPCYTEPAPWCKPNPSYTNTSFHIWTPTVPNQDWVKADPSESCSYQCINWYTGIFCEVAPWVAW